MNRFIAVMAIMTCLAGAGVSQAIAADVRFSCDQLHASEASLNARYTHSDARATFELAVKAPAGAEILSQDRLDVRINGLSVGTVAMTARPDGSRGGSLGFDSYANAGHADPGVAPFPAAWPGVLPPEPFGIRPMARIQVGPLGCSLSS